MEEIICKSLDANPGWREVSIKEEQPETEFVWTEQETAFGNPLSSPDPLEPDDDVPKKKRKINVPKGPRKGRKHDSAESDSENPGRDLEDCVEREESDQTPAPNNLPVPVTLITESIVKMEADPDPVEKVLIGETSFSYHLIRTVPGILPGVSWPILARKVGGEPLAASPLHILFSLWSEECGKWFRCSPHPFRSPTH
jgi:hypothetical protein